MRRTKELEDMVKVEGDLRLLQQEAVSRQKTGQPATGPDPDRNDKVGQRDAAIFENAADNIQIAFADAFTDAFEGNITSAQDFADTLKGIFTRTAGEIAAAMVIKPVLGAIGFGPEGGMQKPWFGGAGSGAMFTAPTRHRCARICGRRGCRRGNWLCGGQLVLPDAGRYKPIQALLSEAGSEARSAAPLVRPFGPGGVMLGSMAGGAIGGFIGRQFGAGKGQDNKVFFQGQLGIGAGGTGAAAQLVVSIDKSIRGLLDATEEGVTNRMLEVAKGVRVQYDKEMSANDMAQPCGRAYWSCCAGVWLGPEQITAGTAEEQIANLEAAIEIMRQMEAIRSARSRRSSGISTISSRRCARKPSA